MHAAAAAAAAAAVAVVVVVAAAVVVVVVVVAAAAAATAATAAAAAATTAAATTTITSCGCMEGFVVCSYMRMYLHECINVRKCGGFCFFEACARQVFTPELIAALNRRIPIDSACAC